MSSTTPRVSLYKPVGGENVNVTTDLNNNWDKIDTNLNFRVVANQTARNAISPYWAGLGVQQTDNGKLYVSNGSAPISASWKEIVQTDNEVAGEMLVGNLIRSTRALSSDSAYETRVTGASFAHWFVKSSGETWWGSGAGTQDTNLYRSAANTLKTDDNLIVSQDLSVGGNVVFSANSAEINSDLSIASTVASSTTETVIALYTIPANDAVVGAVYKLTAFGTASTAGVAPTLKFSGRIGGVAGTQFGTTNAFTCTISQVNRAWKVEVYYTVTATGVSGTGFGNFHCIESQSIAGTTNPVSGMNTRMDGGATHTIDTTAAKDLVITVTWGTNSASNTLTCRGYSAERLA